MTKFIRNVIIMPQCPKCKRQYPSNSIMCPKCKIYFTVIKPTQSNSQSPQYSQQPQYSQPVPPIAPVQQTRKSGCLIAVLTIIGVLFLFGFAIAILGIFSDDKNPDKILTSSETSSEELTVDELKEFDAKTWAQFLDMYTAHNDLAKAMSAYSEGLISAVDFYKYCDSSEKYFMNASLSFNYGVTEDEKIYLSVFETWALADQQACKYLQDFIDSFKTSDLAKADEQIQRGVDAAAMIGENRGRLLVKAGYTDKEIAEIAESIEQDLAAIDK